jgi:hypothetical protein
MSDEEHDQVLLDLVLIRREDGHKFDRRRILVNPNDQRRIALHMRGIAIRDDNRNTEPDNWLSKYEAALYETGKDQPLARISAMGSEE